MADIDSDSNSTIIQIGPSANLLSSSSVNPLLPSEIDLEHANQVESTSNHNSGSDLVQSSQSGQISDDEPSIKKIKLNHNIVDISCGGVLDGHGIAVHEKLEQRLGGILCCAVCLDLPKTAMYQCQMGHLMCAACFSHLLADSRLRDQSATCPNCRVEISKSTAFRNLAVEKAVSELPSECPYCYNEFPHKLRSFHEQNYCQERPTRCVYNRIGCPWMGPYHESFEHEQNCTHPRKSGFEVMAALDIHDAKIKDEQKVFTSLIDLLSFEKIIFNDLQFKPYRTEEFSTKLYYETSRFSAFNQQWLVKARINNSQRNPHQTNERQLSYQLIAKSKPIIPISIYFFALKGPFSDMKVDTKIYRHDYTENSNESEYNLLPLPDNFECNRLLSSKGINFRLLMFLHSK